MLKAQMNEQRKRMSSSSLIQLEIYGTPSDEILEAMRKIARSGTTLKLNSVSLAGFSAFSQDGITSFSIPSARPMTLPVGI
jgi:hypothetical protein